MLRSISHGRLAISILRGNCGEKRRYIDMADIEVATEQYIDDFNKMHESLAINFYARKAFRKLLSHMHLCTIKKGVIKRLHPVMAYHHNIQEFCVVQESRMLYVGKSIQFLEKGAFVKIYNAKTLLNKGYVPNLPEEITLYCKDLIHFREQVVLDEWSILRKRKEFIDKHNLQTIAQKVVDMKEDNKIWHCLSRQ